MYKKESCQRNDQSKKENDETSNFQTLPTVPKIINAKHDNQSMNQTPKPIEDYPISSLLAKMQQKKNKSEQLAKQRFCIEIRMEELKVKVNKLQCRVRNIVRRRNMSMKVIIKDTKINICIAM